MFDAVAQLLRLRPPTRRPWTIEPSLVDLIPAVEATDVGGARPTGKLESKTHSGRLPPVMAPVRLGDPRLALAWRHPLSCTVARARRRSGKAKA